MTGTINPNQGIVQIQTILYLDWICGVSIVNYSIKDLGMLYETSSYVEIIVCTTYYYARAELPRVFYYSIAIYFQKSRAN